MIGCYASKGSGYTDAEDKNLIIGLEPPVTSKDQ